MSKRILIRADDLGYSEGVNYGIAKAVKEGIIGSVGLMPNMPAARHGLDLLKGEKVCYGQHTNICVGKPITDPKQIPSICGEDGLFKPSSAYRQAKEDFVEVDQAVLEIEAQYRRFVELTGEQPRYFEGHAIASENFLKGLEIVAKKHQLPLLPFSLKGPVRFGNTDLYPSMDSMKPDYDPFESLKAAVLKDYGDRGCCMFVCHPGYLDDYILRTSSLTVARTKEVAMACDPQVRQWLKDNGIELVTYDDL